jgi:hypothetical protein
LQSRKAVKRKRQKSREEESGAEGREQVGQSQKAKLPARGANEEEDSEAPRKKPKRKLNVFDNQTTFQWDSVQVRLSPFWSHSNAESIVRLVTDRWVFLCNCHPSRIQHQKDQGHFSDD